MPTLATQANRSLVHHTLGNGEFELFRSMAAPVVGASAIITPANAVVETERLIAEALYNRRPVYMAVPSDVVNKPIVARSDRLGLPVSDSTALAAATEAVVVALEAASTACVLPGILLDRLGLREVVQQFVEAADLPFATMFADKSALEEDHPNYIGMYDGGLMDPAVREFVETCDVVVAFGTMATDFNTGAFTSNLDPRQDRRNRPSQHAGGVDRLPGRRDGRHPPRARGAVVEHPSRARVAFQSQRWPMAVKLHGDFRERRLMITEQELREQDADLRRFVTNASRTFGIVVCGYSGRDASVMEMFHASAAPLRGLKASGGW